MLSGYEETEREILATLRIESNINGMINHKQLGNSSSSSTMNRREANNGARLSTIYSNRFMLNKPKSRFKTVAISIIAISRIK